VIGIDNLCTGALANLTHLAPHKGFSFIRNDVSEAISVGGPVDAVMHLASPASPKDYLRMPIDTLKAGSLGTLRTIALAKEKRACYFLASTSEVYGDPQIHPQPEGYWGHVNPVGPRGVYDEAKRFAEAMTMAYQREYGLDVRISRTFNTYGPRMRPHDGRVVTTFITQALNGEPLTVYGDGSQTRSFCYVDDQVRGLVALLDAGRVGPVNIGNPDEYTILELAHTVLDLTNSASEIRFEPLPVDDPIQRRPDISLAQRVLHWHPEIDLREGIERTVSWFRTHPAWPAEPQPADLPGPPTVNGSRPGGELKRPLEFDSVTAPTLDRERGRVMRTGTVSRLAVVGTGYVGTVVAACFARLGYEVVGIENDPAKLAQLQTGRIPFHEPGLEDLVNSGLRSGLLRFTADYRDGVTHSDAIFVCVGTPSLPNGSADMSAMKDAAQSVARAIRHRTVVVTKSTIPIGGSRLLRGVLDGVRSRANGAAASVALVHNPEFLREGSAIADFLHPDRVVLGSDDGHALSLVTELYRPILQQSFEGADSAKRPGLMCTDLTTAETVKYGSNAFLATKISFINELAQICDLVGADVTGVATGMGLDRRISKEFLSAGLGWGGSCFGKDLRALITTARQHGYEPTLLAATVQVNARQQEVALHKLALHFSSLAGRRVGVLGLAFKPGTDDMRDSPALRLAQRLVTLGAEVIAYDPLVSGVPNVLGLTVAGGPYETADGADAVVLATEWPDFLLLDLAELRARMRGDVFVDCRNVFDPHVVQAAGLRYEAVGRSKVTGARPTVHVNLADDIEIDLCPPASASPEP
jgi:nucleotide sugar dehydrogenase